MNRETASLILTSLCERAENSNTLVELTSVEIRALQVLFGKSVSRPEPIVQGNGSDDRNLPEQVLRWKPEEVPDDNVILCLDFGTSYSKVWGCQLSESSDDFNFIDISFGENDDGTKIYFLPSELFVHGDVIYFGMAARRKFEAVEASQDRLIDGPKQYITLGTEVSDLHQRPLRREQDPSQSLSQRDALVLYLSYLNYLADVSLKESGFTTNVRRRYTHPGWDEEIRKANSEAMRRIVEESVALAKCYPDELARGALPLERARNLTRIAQKAASADLPSQLLGDTLLEATAAGAGALMSTTERSRQVYVILDIGAGTTDVAGCVCVNNPNSERLKVAEVTSATKAIRMAGNLIDSILLSEILSRSSFASGTNEHDRMLKVERKWIREYKEALFNDGFLTVQLTSDEVVEVDLEEFLKNRAVEKLFGEIRSIVTDAAFQVVGDDQKVFLVATGGGASLPVVRDLVSSPVEKNGRRLRLRQQPSMPEDLMGIYPQLVGIYPQMAVAVGGAHPEIPKQVSSIREGIRDPGRKILLPTYR